MIRNILLVRHGRSAHVQGGLHDRAGFLRWREAYEAAGLHADDQPPAPLADFARGCGIAVCSDAPRAIQSAKRLASEVTTTPLLRELELRPARLPWIRLPLFGWALTYGLRRSPATAAELDRAREAAEWLSALAERRGPVIAVTHHSFRTLVAKELIARGWACDRSEGRRHWSAWSLISIPGTENTSLASRPSPSRESSRS